MSLRPGSTFRNYAAWNDFKLVCRKTLHSNNSNTPGEHYHSDFYELVVVADGSGKHSCGGQEWSIQRGNVFLIQPNQSHCYMEYDNLVIYNLLFSKYFLEYALPDLNLLPNFQLLFNSTVNTHCNILCGSMYIAPAALPEILNLLEEMHQRNSDLQPGDKTLLLSNFARVMYLLTHNISHGSGKSSENTTKISRLLAELQQTLNEQWNMEKMAQLCNMSISCFRQHFFKITGTPPIDYLLKLRLNQAAAALENTAAPVSDIAFACGFKDFNYFSRQFKKYFGIQPSRYRKQAQASKVIRITKA